MRKLSAAQLYVLRSLYAWSKEYPESIGRNMYINGDQLTLGTWATLESKALEGLIDVAPPHQGGFYWFITEEGKRRLEEIDQQPCSNSKS